MADQTATDWAWLIQAALAWMDDHDVPEGEMQASVKRLRTALGMPLPAEPTPEPGTAGAATVRGVEGVRVMRTDGTDGADEMWLSAVFILGYRGHQAEHVTDFVPDDQGKYRALLATVPNRAEYAEKIRGLAAQRDDARRALADVGTFVTEIDTDILHDGSYAEILRAEFKALGAAYDEATDRAIVAERDARAEHAEVERLRGLLGSLGEDRNALALRLDRLSVESVREALRTAQRDARTGEPWFDEAVQRVLRIVTDDEPGVSTPAVTTPSTETPAETPAPAAFVLPEREAFTAAVEDILGGPAQSEADQILALLAEHAVTPERLAPVLHKVMTTHTPGRRWAELAQDVLDRLTGEAS